MYLHFTKGTRRINVLSTEEGFTAFTYPVDYDQSFLRHCFYFPTAMYRFAKSYFRRHRIAPSKGSVYNIVCYLPERGNFLVVLELSPERTYPVVEKNVHDFSD